MRAGSQLGIGFESEEIVLEEEPTQDKLDVSAPAARLQTLDHRAHSVGDLGGCGHRTSRGERWLT